MRTLSDWLGEYGTSHQNPVNKLLHWICVPLIVLTLCGLFWSLPVPGLFSSISPWLNWATVFTGVALLYYLALSPALAAGMLVSFVLVLLVTQWLSTLPWPLWVTSLAIFVVAWIGQFIGHAVEGKRPSFFKDVQFLMIGPLWLLAAAYRRMGLGY
jgi:uncharacterized membrane protein YGL010W